MVKLRLRDYLSEETHMPHSDLMEVSGYERCGGCRRHIGNPAEMEAGSRRGFYHENKQEPYHYRCGWKFSRKINNKTPWEVGLKPVIFIPKEKRKRA